MEIKKLPERWEKVIGSDGQYFNWSVHSFCFEINAQKTEQLMVATPEKNISSLKIKYEIFLNVF